MKKPEPGDIVGYQGERYVFIRYNFVNNRTVWLGPVCTSGYYAVNVGQFNVIYHNQHFGVILKSLSHVPKNDLASSYFRSLFETLLKK